MNQQTYITEEEREKCKKVANAFWEIYQEDDVLVVDAGRFGFVKLQNYIFKGEQLVDVYYTDENGQFTSKEYICGDNWTIKELEPSEGYLLDPTVHHIGAEPQLYTVEHNVTSNDVVEDVIIKTEARYTTVNELYELWKILKRGLKDNTFENYQYMYETFVRPKIGQQRISNLKKSDIKRYYNYLADERGLKASTIDSIHTVLHQILDMAVDDDYIRNNPSDNVLRELKQSHIFKTEKRRGLTRPEQDLFLDYLKNTPKAQNWYPIFAVMLGTGLRVGEVTGLRWCDIDLDEGIIDINHTLVYYDHRTSEGKKGCYFNINTPKTEAGNRQVPMLDFVKKAFLMEKERQEMFDLHCEVTIDGYRDFIFINRFGQTQHQSTLNKAIRRIIRDCNDEQLLKDTNAKVLLLPLWSI